VVDGGSTETATARAMMALGKAIDRQQEIVVNPNMLRARVELAATIEPEPSEPRLIHGALGRSTS
jgi:hypothetical protein